MSETDVEFESLHDESTLVAAVVSLTNADVDILDRVEPEDFSDAHFGEIWRAARQVRVSNKMISPRNIRAIHDNQPVQNRLKAAQAQVVTNEAVGQAEHAVKDLARKRRLQAALKAGLERLQTADSYSVALADAHAELERLQGSETPKNVHWFGSLVDEWQDWVNTPKERQRVIATPWEGLNDRLAGGLHAGRSYVIGGRPGAGKSVAGANIALHAAENGHPSVVFSVEMGRIEVTSRMLASGSQTNYGHITKRTLDNHDMARIGEYIDSNSHIPLAIVDKANVTLEYINSTCRSIKRKHGLDVVVVDYLQLLKESDSKVPRERQVANISRGMKLLARDLECVVVIACQLNRNSANEKRTPTLADLRESGSIEQDADVVVLLHHADEESGEIELAVAKNRTGPPGAITRTWAAHQSRIA